MRTADRLGIIAAFEVAWQRKATPEEMVRLQRVQSVLGVKDNDAIIIPVIAWSMVPVDSNFSLPNFILELPCLAKCVPN